MGSIKVNITCGGENMEVQQLQIEPDNWHHRFEISVVSKMINNKNVIRIEMNEVNESENTDKVETDKVEIIHNTQTKIEPITKGEIKQETEPKTFAKDETSDTVDGSVWL